MDIDYSISITTSPLISWVIRMKHCRKLLRLPCQREFPLAILLKRNGGSQTCGSTGCPQSSSYGSPAQLLKRPWVLSASLVLIQEKPKLPNLRAATTVLATHFRCPGMSTPITITALMMHLSQLRKVVEYRRAL